MSQPWNGLPGESYSSSGPAYGPAGEPQAALSPYSTPYSPMPIGVVGAPVVRGQLVSAGGRFGGFLLDGLLALVTLGIGWLIWSLFTWSTGQTPAKRLLGYVVVDANTGVPFDWGRMALRQFVIEGLLGWLLNAVTLSVYFWIDSLMIFGEGQRTLHDRMANSVVRHI